MKNGSWYEWSQGQAERNPWKCKLLFHSVLFYSTAISFLLFLSLSPLVIFFDLLNHCSEGLGHSDSCQDKVTTELLHSQLLVTVFSWLSGKSSSPPPRCPGRCRCGRQAWSSRCWCDVWSVARLTVVAAAVVCLRSSVTSYTTNYVILSSSW